MQPTKKIRDAPTNTDLFPRYRAIGTQKKFCWNQQFGVKVLCRTYSEAQGEDTIRQEVGNLCNGLVKLVSQQDERL